jgi:tRNA pseudouridine38-40 synthase
VRLRIDLSYDGSGFHGWATQPGLRTVQEELEKALDRVLRTTGTSLTVAGRTDTGVHARGQVAHVDLAPGDVLAAAGRSRGTPTEALARRLNGVLDADVRIRRVTEAPPGFDARFSAVWRRYAYRVADRPETVDPLTRDHVLAWPRPLDLDAMNAASRELLGEHDFAAFCRRKENATTVRAITALTWRRDPDGVLVATVQADAFCQSMVRSLVGAMLVVGDGRRDPDWPGSLLSRRERAGEVTVAPAHGLTLIAVGYPDETRRYGERAELTRRRRQLR